MKKNILIFILLFSAPLINAQNKYGYRWHLQYHEYFDFRTNPVRVDVVTPQPFYSAGESGFTMCNKYGDLMFQSGGCFILNKNLIIMRNGDSINSNYTYRGWCRVSRGDGDFPFYQSSIAIPYPQQDSMYLAFNFDTDNAPIPFPRHLYYHIVDMSQENGLGAVIEKKKIAIQDSLSRSGLTVTKHSNGMDWWVILGKLESNCYYLVKVTSSGVQVPIKHCLGDKGVAIDLGSNSIFSPNGKKFVKTYFPDSTINENIFLYDFDNSTGQLSNFKKLKVPEDIFYFTGVQFSANNRYLYVSYLSRIYQFDMESRDIQASIVVIGDVSHIPKDNQKGQLFEMRLAPDGKIYVASPFSHKYLSVINRPNCLGKLSDFRPYAVELKRFSYGGLPNIPIFEQPPANYTCDSLPSPTQELPESITLSPNPAQGIININTTKAFDKYIIINAMGQAVQSGKWNAAQSEIDVADLPEGIYFVQLLNNQSHTQAIGRFVLKK